jgi:starch phosphorylase
VHLGALAPQDVAVQVYHGTIDPSEEIADYGVVDMSATEMTDDGDYVYTGIISCGKSGLQGYTVRILPFHPNLNDLHAPGLVLWAS